MTNRTCTIGDCDKPVLARGMCGTHYSRWHRQGGEIRPKSRISDSERRCSRCREVKHPAEFYKSGSWCAECERSNKRARYVAINVPLPASYCVECGVRYRPRRRTDITCSLSCADMRRRRFRRIEAPITRAMRALANVEMVDPQIVFDRDDWICQICHTDIPRDAVWPSRESPAMDHIKPISRGGDHSYANCQASHFRCNASKGAKFDDLELPT